MRSSRNACEFRKTCVVLLGGALLLSGCSAPDYTAVRDWASIASRAADYAPIAASCLDRESGWPEPPRWLGDGRRAMQDALSTYLASLVTIAADGVLPYREDPFVQLAARARLASVDGADAITELGGLLRRATRRNAQAPQLRETVAAADSAVQTLVAALRTAVADAGTGLTEERGAVAAAYRQLEQESRDAASRQAIRDVGVIRDREYAAGLEARTNYDRLLVSIAEGHALLKARASYLSQEETARQLRRAEERLRRAEALLPRAMASMPAGIACVGPQLLPGIALPPLAVPPVITDPA
jgi:hypothetical protein